MAKHNKKRNVGLIHEQLVRYASEKIVEGKRSIAEKAIDVLNNHFEEGTELYREFRLFNSLVHTRTSNDDLARRIIKESKEACKIHDGKKLRSEKSDLIRSINHRIDETYFYNQRVENYKIFATVQALLNEWRGGSNLSPKDVVDYEIVLEEWISRKDKKVTMDKNIDANPLTFKIMSEKFNKKYAGFDKHQMALLEYKLLGKDDKVEEKIKNLKVQATLAIESFYSNCDNPTLVEKRVIVEEKIKNLPINSNDETIKKALIISHLTRELVAENEQ